MAKELIDEKSKNQSLFGKIRLGANRAFEGIDKYRAGNPKETKSKRRKGRPESISLQRYSGALTAGHLFGAPKTKNKRQFHDEIFGEWGGL